MKLPRRNFLHLAAGAAALPAVSRIAWAQAYPTAAGADHRRLCCRAATSTSSRALMGQWLSERLRQPFIVENRPGAGTNIAHRSGRACSCRTATRSSWLSTAAINQPTLYEKLNFNFVRDIAPVAAVVRTPFVMVVNPSVPAKTVAEFIAYAKTNSGKLSMASSGIGTTRPCGRRVVQDDGGRRLWCTCPIAEPAPRSPISSADKCMSTSPRCRRRSSTSGRAGCAHWR